MKDWSPSGPVSDADYELLEQLAEFYQGITSKVAGRLRDMGLENTTRSFKSTGTIAEKLRRTHLSLGEIQDLAGTRIVIDRGAWTRTGSSAASRSRSVTARSRR